MERFPSGQRGQTVNLLLIASVVRIHPSPPEKTTCFDKSFFQRNKSLAGFVKCTPCVKYANGVWNASGRWRIYFISLWQSQKFHNLWSKLYHILRKQNISLKTFASKSFGFSTSEQAENRSFRFFCKNRNSPKPLFLLFRKNAHPVCLLTCKWTHLHLPTALYYLRSIINSIMRLPLREQL